jgi:acylphosphatase
LTFLCATVTGIVQGVGFRYFVQRRASALGLNGYVSNLPNGDVEVNAEGMRGTLEELVEYLRKGPPMSSVKYVSVGWSERDRPQFDDFRIIF